MVKIFCIDLFCGAGGTSTGIHLASGNNEVIACVNHDKNAIKSHLENHPNWSWCVKRDGDGFVIEYIYHHFA
ncbi:hypothetical protein [Empedobacter tilapiae]|uniref:hypothetical protein n=1 Tax=Empedobacter tilapiae TaxID=2491114 RepID=UPI0028D72912|nr:hypothetical protein [Empedobacter tilapiae]